MAEFTVSGRGLDSLYELQLNDVSKRTVNHRGTVIEFQALNPYPVSGGPNNPASYQARIEIK